MALITIVTFKDEDGDEFPVGINGILEGYEEAERIGREHAERFLSDGTWHPNGALTLDSIDYPRVA